MWMIVFLLLPLLGLAYCGWHLWTLVPLSRLWRALIVAAGTGAFLLMFLNLGRVIDRMPMPLARFCYDVGNSSVFVLLYLVIIFLALDLGRLLHIVPTAWLHNSFGTTVTITKGDKSVNALKLMALMQMGIKQGETVTVSVEGEKEEEVAAALEAFFKANL